MSRMTWNAPERRFFETGLDRGVLFPKGTPPPGELITNKAPNPSFELTGALFEISRNLFVDPALTTTDWAFAYNDGVTFDLDTVTYRSGTSSVKYTIEAGANRGAILSSDSQIPLTAMFRGGVWFKAPAGKDFNVSGRINNSAGGYAGESFDAQTITATGNWQRLTVNYTLPESYRTDLQNQGHTTFQPGLQITSTEDNTAGLSFNLDEVIGVSNETLPDYFDGSTGGTYEFPTSWVGSPNNSHSVKQAYSVANFYGAGAFAMWRVGQWRASGDSSMEIRSRGTTVDCYAEVINLNLQQGKTHTISCTFHTPVALKGALGPRARRIAVFTRGGGSGPYSEHLSPAAPATGTGRVSVTFPLPVGHDEAIVRLYNGSPTIDDYLFVDDLLVVEGDDDYPFFSGFTADNGAYTYEWLGTANDSASTRLSHNTLAVPWDGLTSVEESGGEGAKAYYADGRPFLFLPTPKEYKATLNAYTYPDAFSEIMGLVEATDGMYLDSQPGAAFDFSYRTLVGSGVDGAEHGYKIHLVYNAIVTPGALTYETLSDSINPSTLSWEIQAVPVKVEGFRPTAHIIIDTRHMDPAKIAAIEELIYGSVDHVPKMPAPQTVFDILNYGDTIIVIDNGDGTFDVEGSYENVYLISDGEFRVDNVDGQDNGDGTFTISTTEA